MTGGKMSDNKIDELSEMLGRISADISHVRQKIDVIDNKVETLQERSVEHSMTIKSAHKRIDDFNNRVEKVEDTVKDHESLKNRGMGIVAFVGFLFGTLGAAITKVFHLWN